MEIKKVVKQARRAKEEKESRRLERFKTGVMMLMAGWKESGC